MTGILARTCRKLKQKLCRRLPERYRRDDSGLTTLEWLLIVAAVAGLAALAVVLVTNVVSDTSEQISGRSARETAVRVAAQSIQDQHIAGELTNKRAEERCERLPITYSDIVGMTAVWVEASDTCTVTIPQ
jgi:Flp pilus assembly pilin Flp